jgi:hypothetical protein
MIQMTPLVIILLLLNSCLLMLDSAAKLKESIRYYAHLNIKKIWSCLCDLILPMFEKSRVYAGSGGGLKYRNTKIVARILLIGKTIYLYSYIQMHKNMIGEEKIHTLP